MGGGSPPGRSRGYGVPGGITATLIRNSQIDRGDSAGKREVRNLKPTEDWVAQHLMFVWRLAQERVGDGAGRVREAGEVRSCC